MNSRRSCQGRVAGWHAVGNQLGELKALLSQSEGKAETLQTEQQLAAVPGGDRRRSQLLAAHVSHLGRLKTVEVAKGVGHPQPQHRISGLQRQGLAVAGQGLPRTIQEPAGLASVRQQAMVRTNVTE